jgi:hypothetical protein
MVAIKGHFDGKVFVPDEPLDLPRNQRVLMRIERLDEPAERQRGTAGSALLRFSGSIDSESLRLMEEAIREGCERPDSNGW